MDIKSTLYIILIVQAIVTRYALCVECLHTQLLVIRGWFTVYLYRSDTDHNDTVHLQFRHHYHLKFHL